MESLYTSDYVGTPDTFLHSQLLGYHSASFTLISAEGLGKTSKHELLLNFNPVLTSSSCFIWRRFTDVLWIFLGGDGLILLFEEVICHVLQHFLSTVTPGRGGGHQASLSDVLTNWPTISHRHSTIHHRGGMHFGRGAETNFCADSSLNGPQSIAASWYVVVWVRDTTFLTFTLTVAPAVQADW